MDREDGALALVLGEDAFGLARAHSPFLRIRLLETKDGRGRPARLRDYSPPLDELTPLGEPLRRGESPGARLWVAFTPVLAPYRLGGFSYDPPTEIEQALEAAYALATARRGPWDAFAAWAVAEAGLYRFASDPTVTAALDAAEGEPEWRRFAYLNELYRSIIRAILPLGVAPPGWTRELRALGQRARQPPGGSMQQERRAALPVAWYRAGLNGPSSVPPGGPSGLVRSLGISIW